MSMVNDLKYTLTIDGKSRSDKFAPELVYFPIAYCMTALPVIVWEGRINVHIINALYKSAQTGRPVRIKFRRRMRDPR